MKSEPKKFRPNKIDLSAVHAYAYIESKAIIKTVMKRFGTPTPVMPTRQLHTAEIPTLFQGPLSAGKTRHTVSYRTTF